MSTYNKMDKSTVHHGYERRINDKSSCNGESSWLTFDDHFKSGIQVTGSGGHSDCLYAESCRNKVVRPIFGQIRKMSSPR